jgi:uncharacterized protein (TIGR02757 family)
MIRPALKPYLDRLSSDFDHRFLATDPLAIVRRYADAGDREVAGLVASCLAYGNVTSIQRSVEDVLHRLGPAPADAVDGLSDEDLLLRLRGFRHRFTAGRDLAALLGAARRMRRRHGSIGEFFKAGYNRKAATLREALISFVDRAMEEDLSRFYRRPPRAGRGIRFLLPSPREGSGCKRLNLYLRWMVRRDDGLDLGLWQGVLPRQLLVPVDTHVARIAAYIGLTRRRSASWKTTEEITASLRKLDPGDPVRYDFALCRLGILDACPRRRDPLKCATCSLLPVCRL